MLKRGKRWLGALLALNMMMGLVPAAVAETEPVSGTLAKGTYMDAEGNMQSYEVAFDTPLPSDGCELATGSYYLTEDLDLTTDFTIADNAVVKLDLAGHILRGTGKAAVVTVVDSACLEVYDSDANADNATPTTHYYTVDEAGVWVFDDANTSGTPWTGGVITGGGNTELGNSTIQSRGGLFARHTNYDPDASPVAISLFGGSICGTRHKLAPRGAGIAAESAKVFVAGGSICGNQKGLCVRAPCFTMTGGLLQGDSSADYPSIDMSVPTQYPGAMVMRGGTIRNASIKIGESTRYSRQYCRFTMYGGEITGTWERRSVNPSYIVGVYDSDFEMYGGSIHDASVDHVIALEPNAAYGDESDHISTFLLDGGTIANNSVVNTASLSWGDKVVIRSGKIVNNSGLITILDTWGTSGEVLGSGACVIEGGEINDNHSSIYVGGSGFLSLSGAVKLTGNHQGNIYLHDGCKATIAGPLRNSEKITVSMKTPGVFTTGWSAQMGNADPADYFTSVKEGYEVVPLRVDGVTEAALVEVPEGNAEIGSVRLTDGTLRATVYLASGLDGAVAFFAAYAQGQMVDIQQAALTPGYQSVSFSVPANADMIKLFVLSENAAPLCQAYRVKL